MRKVALLLMFVPCLVMGQLVYPSPNETYNASEYVLRHNHGRADSLSRIYDVALTSTLVDTTQGYSITPFKTLYLTLSAPDTCTILVGYELSDDGVTWRVPTTVAGAAGTALLYDSLKVKIDANVQKSIDFTSVALGERFIRWIFSVSIKAYVLGVPTPTYRAYFTFKKK